MSGSGSARLLAADYHPNGASRCSVGTSMLMDMASRHVEVYSYVWVQLKCSAVPGSVLHRQSSLVERSEVEVPARHLVSRQCNAAVPNPRAGGDLELALLGG